MPHPRTMQRITLFALAAMLAGSLAAQSNTVPGLDGRLEILDNLTFWARRGAAFPGGEVGMAMRNTMCNPGSVNLPWFAVPQPNHPKFGFLITRESGGRMVQISDRSFCKHAFTSASTNGGCGTCNGIGGTQMGLRCSDTYGAGNNGSRSDLGPADEINPWLGTWTMLGSYFDVGDPQTGTGPADGQRSLNTSGFDEVKNRVTVKEADMNVAGARYFYGIELIHEGESENNRGDNIKSRGFTPSFNGTSWSFPNSAVGETFGSILQHWTGSSLNSGRNGNDDGTFFVAVVVTPLGGGNFHYEYAVHNTTNNRGGAALHIPCPASATVANAGFRDIDTNALNDWTNARVGNELVFSAAANNALNWNTIYNFWFDCNVAPGGGAVLLDEARVGPGLLQVVVTANVPGGAPVAIATNVGNSAGCGQVPACTSAFYEVFGNGSLDLANTSMGMVLSGTTYNVGPAAGSFVAPTGTNLGLTDDSQTTVALGFTFPYPGGSTTQLQVCSNGFVSIG